MKSVFAPLCVLAFACSWAVPAGAEEWPRFRGPNGAGISGATTIPVSWAPSDYRWQIRLPGLGHSSPVVWGDLLVVTCGDEQTGERMVLGIDAHSGAQRWLHRLPGSLHRKHKLNSFASSTPAVDEQRIYVCWATPEAFEVAALDHHGQQVWRRDLGPFQAGHGEGVSPIVHRELVVIPKEHEGPSELFALDRRTGEVRWRVERDSKSTWSTPCVLERGGREELIFSNWHYGITAITPQTGELRWRADVFDKAHMESSIGSPIVAGDLVLAVSGWLAVRQEIVAVRADPAGRLAERVYSIDRGVGLCTTPLAVGNLLFLWADEGIVTCADLATGKVHWRRRVGGTYYASPIAVQSKVYNVSADGEVVVLAAQDQFELLARNPLGESSHSTPAVANGMMYLRTFTQLFAIGSGEAVRP